MALINSIHLSEKKDIKKVVFCIKLLFLWRRGGGGRKGRSKKKKRLYIQGLTIFTS